MSNSTPFFLKFQNHCTLPCSPHNSPLFCQGKLVWGWGEEGGVSGNTKTKQLTFLWPWPGLMKYEISLSAGVKDEGGIWVSHPLAAFLIKFPPSPPLSLSGFKHKQQKVKEKIFHWLAFSGARGGWTVKKDRDRANIKNEWVSKTGQ
jgi:hypothetical protein